MTSAYSESWNFFHSNTTTPAARQKFPPDNSANGLSNHDVESAAISPPPNYTEISNEDILLEIERLQQEVVQLKHSAYPQQSNGLWFQTKLYRSSLDTPSQPPKTLAQALPAPASALTDEATTISIPPDLPRCWLPCCNGRTFSNQSNLARHQREKRGEGAKLECSFCGVRFSRGSARDKHEAERRCRVTSDSSVNVRT